MALTFLEQIEDDSPSISGFSLNSGRSVRTFLLEEPAANDLQTAIIEVLGETNMMASANGLLNRTPPLADPCFPWMYAYNIGTIKGIGQYTVQAAEAELEVPSLPQFALYDNYWLSVEFGPRAYPILLDQDININNGSWYNFAGTQQTYQYATEWDRYTYIEQVPQFNSVTAQQGQYTFQSTGCANGNQYAASPRMPLPDQIVKMTWYQVPYRLITSSNSFIARPGWVGCINQNAWNGYPAGSLLYLGYNPKIYTPPVQQEYAFAPGVYSTDKLCDIEFTFLYTNRTANDLTTANTNHNFIQSGHNLQPWLGDRRYHYAEGAVTTSSSCPGGLNTASFFSIPFELLQTECDAGIAIVSNG